MSDDIESLRRWLREKEDEVKGLELANQDLVDERDSFAREIERLRDELAECERVGGKFMEEIERLRAADVLMVAQFESQEREITMLRRLLREGVEYPGITQWLQRVREALGETVSYQWSTATHPYPRERTWSDCEAEIERLRGDISYLESQNSKTIHRAATEITRLRHMLDDVLAEVELPQSIEKRVREALGE